MHSHESKPGWGELAREHSGLALTLTYLFLIAVGMLYEWFLFRRLGLNILYYAEAADFLLVPFREPLVVFITILPLPLYAIYIRGARWLGRSLTRQQLNEGQLARHQRIMNVVNVIAVVLWSVAFTAHFADARAEAIRSGESRAKITIELASEKRFVKGPLIGSTGQFFFVYDAQAKLTRVIPIENIAEATVEPRPPRRGLRPRAVPRSS